MPLTYTQITGLFDDGSGTPMSGTVSFIPSTSVYAAGIPVVTPATPVQAQITGGQLQSMSGGAVKLLATDNAGLSFSSLTGFFYWSVQITVGGQAQPAWSFFLPSSPTTVDLYKLANTAASGGGGFTNPMSALGDLIYENATPAAARLPGDTSNTRKFLRTQAALGVAQAPAWDTLTAADVPGVDGVTVTGTPSAGQVPTATSPTAATWQAPSGGFQAWQFQPETYGAKGDGKVIGDAQLFSTTTLTSATAAFTSADTGKHIMINGAIGATNIPLITTITYVNATTVTLGSAATVSGTGFAAVYGTDDTAAINSAVSAAKTYALANQYFAEVIFGAKLYIVSSGPTQSVSPQFNAQIPVPYPNVNGSTQKLVIALTGAGDAGFYQFWESLIPNVAGTALISMLTSAPSTPDATFGQQSVIGGPSAGGAFTGGFANTKVVVRGIEVVCPVYTNLYAYDFGYVSAMRVQQSSAHIFAPAGVGGGNGPLLKDVTTQVAFTSKIGTGLRSPVITNNADCVIDDFTAEGYARGLYLFDHLTAGRVGTIYNDVALIIDTTQGPSGISHGVFISLLSAEVYNGGILAVGSNYCPLYINLDAECTGPAYDISDGGNALHGVVHWTDPADNRLPGITGAASLKVINDKLGPGVWASPPAVPATTVAQVNTSYRDAMVYITSGGAAVTAIAVGGTTTGATLSTTGTVGVRVPSGQSITLTYAAAAPTWVWRLE